MSVNNEEFDAAVAEVERRVAQGRQDGRYPEELDAQLASEFSRQAKDPLWFQAVDRLPEAAARLRGLVFGRTAIEHTSSMPGGAALHKAVSLIVSRQVLALSQQLNTLSREVASALDDTAEALGEMRSALRGDVFGDIDAVHHRLVVAEQRLARAEAELAELKNATSQHGADATSDI